MFRYIFTEVIYTLDKFTFWQKCEFCTVQLVYSAYHIPKHGEDN